MGNKLKPNKGYGYVGTWYDGKLGWFLPRFLCGNNSKYPEMPCKDAEQYADDEGIWFYKCEIIVRPVISKKTGKPIRRLVRKPIS